MGLDQKRLSELAELIIELLGDKSKFRHSFGWRWLGMILFASAFHNNGVLPCLGYMARAFDVKIDTLLDDLVELREWGYVGEDAGGAEFGWPYNRDSKNTSGHQLGSVDTNHWFIRMCGNRYMEKCFKEITKVVTLTAGAAESAKRAGGNGYDQRIKRIRPNLAQRKFVVERDDGICQYCGQPGDQIDHVLALAHGGMNDTCNMVVACAHCNQSKGDRRLEQWVHNPCNHIVMEAQ